MNFHLIKILFQFHKFCSRLKIDSQTLVDVWIFFVASAIHIESLINKYIILKIHRRHFNISINVHHKNQFNTLIFVADLKAAHFSRTIKLNR